jgi:hypothetical protein
LLAGQGGPVGCGLFHSSMVIELSNGCQDPPRFRGGVAARPGAPGCSDRTG